MNEKIFSLLEEIEREYKNDRLKWGELFFLVTKLISFRSSCAKTKQAALLINDNRIISFGVNGPPAGSINCIFDGGEISCGKNLEGSCREGIHAEQNMFAYAARYGIRVDNCIVFCTETPCINCAKLIVATGIKEFYYINKYRLDEGEKYLIKHGVKIKHCLEYK